MTCYCDLSDQECREAGHQGPAKAAEAFAARKVSFSVEEYRALADRLADAALKLKLAVDDKKLAGIRSAYHDLHDVAHQTAELNRGLMHAIEAAQQESRR